MVLLDASVDARAPAVPHRPCRPSCQPATDRLGGNELSPVGGADRGGGDPGFGLPDPDPCRRAGRGAVDHDDHGGVQPYGVGDVSALDGARADRPLADYRQPSSAAS